MNLQAANSLLSISELQTAPAGIIGLGYVGLPPGHGRTSIRVTTNAADLNARTVLIMANQTFYHPNITQLKNRDVSVVRDL